MPRQTAIHGKKRKDPKKTNRYNLFCVFVREWVARGDVNGGSATTMSRIVSPYWEVLTNEERAYWRRRAREIYRPTPEDIANAQACGHRSGLAEHGGGGSAVVRLMQSGTPSREQFREWYGQLTQSGILDVISEGLVFTTASVWGSKRIRATRWWQEDEVRGFGNDMNFCSASRLVEPSSTTPNLDISTSFPPAPWTSATPSIYGSPQIAAASFNGECDPWHPILYPYLAAPTVSPSPWELAWPAFIAHDPATVDHQSEGVAHSAMLVDLFVDRLRTRSRAELTHQRINPAVSLSTRATTSWNCTG
ncbi:hypothetical protein ACG7TL_008465 [Trametes sanguinea]